MQGETRTQTAFCYEDQRSSESEKVCNHARSALTQMVMALNSKNFSSFIDLLIEMSGQLVAVEMLVTQHPPHRSVRAELPHTALASG